MNLRTLSFVALGILPACSSLSSPTVHGSGTTLVEERAVAGFDSVRISGGAEVFLSQGDDEFLSIECDDNLLPHILTTIDDGVLHIRFESGSWSPSERTVYRITARAIDDVRLGGSVDLTATELSAADFSFRLSGAGKASFAGIEAKSVVMSMSGATQVTVGALSAESTAIDISGSGTLSADGGKCGALALEISGSGTLDMPNVLAKTAVLKTSGSAIANVWVESTIDAKLSGSGEVVYRGAPSVDSRISGSGHIRPANE